MAKLTRPLEGRRRSAARALRGLAALAACVALHGCGGSAAEHDAHNDRERLASFLEAQRFASARFLPAEADWTFLGATARSARAVGLGRVANTVVVSKDMTTVEGHRRCHAFGRYVVWRPLDKNCRGEWLQFRADRRSSGASSFRLNWSGSPRRAASYDLDIQQPLATQRVLTDAAGDIAYVQNGSGVEAHRLGGQVLWRTSGLGYGEIVDVDDLDGDGIDEVIVSTHAYSNPLNASGTGPGRLFVLSSRDGEVLWRHNFEGLEFGPNRYRTTIASVGAAATKSIFATMTYSPHLLRFDFDGGVRNGRLVWRSAPMAYDSPDKAPLLADLDGDGQQEVVVDSLGVLYVFDAAHGTLKSSVTYANAPTFGGFLAAGDVDGDGSPEIISVSASPYWKGYAIAAWRDGVLAVERTHAWEAGLENQQITVVPMASLLYAPGRAGARLAVQLKTGSESRIQAVDLATGTIAWQIGGAQFRQLLARRGSAHYIAADVDDAAAVLSLEWSGYREVDRQVGSTWISGVAYQGLASSSRSGFGAHPALAKRSNGALVAVSVDASGSGVRRVETGLDASAKLGVDGVGANSLIISDGRRARRVDADGAVQTWFEHPPRVYATPLVADLDGAGRVAIIVPSGDALVRYSMTEDTLAGPQVLVGNAPRQEHESFMAPAVVRRAGSAARDVAAFAYEADDQGLATLWFGVRAADGSLRWSMRTETGAWEFSSAVLERGPDDLAVALRHSLATTVFDAATGAVRWQAPVVGECQRQMAALDWNGDGFDDLAVQAGPLTLLHDGGSGAVLAQQRTTTSYGGYSAFLRGSGDGRTLAQFNSGGLTMLGAAGTLTEQQLDTRRLESLPLVVGPRTAGGPDLAFQVSGVGTVRVVDAKGAVIDAAELGLDVASVTGAFVDDDDAMDLLVGTYSGVLVAVSGADLQVRWRLVLGAMVGPAVAADVDGDGRGEIIVVTGDGRLEILRP